MFLPVVTNVVAVFAVPFRGLVARVSTCRPFHVDRILDHLLYEANNFVSDTYN